MAERTKTQTRRPVIFLGSSSEARHVLDKVALQVEKAGAEARRWPEAFRVGDFFLESLIKAAKEVDGALVIASPDDEGVMRENKYWIPRDNVLVELGLFLSSLGRKRAGLISVLEEGKSEIKLPSDLDGLVHIRYRVETPVKNDQAVADWMKQFFTDIPYRKSELVVPHDGLYTWRHMTEGLQYIELKMERDNFMPDVVVGLGRSGGVVGGVLAAYLGSLPLEVIDIEYSRKGNELAVDLKADNFDLPNGTTRALVIEGATTGGKTLSVAKDFLSRRFPDVEFRYAVLIQAVTSQFSCEYYAFLESRVLSSLPWHGPRSRTFLAPSQPGA